MTSPEKEFPHHLLPTRIITKRERTKSQSDRANEGPEFNGTVKTFCRQKGHGFISPSDGKDDLFVHISDIEGELVPKAGDEVKYKTIHVPPKNEKIQAVHVRLVNVNDEHEKWADLNVSY